ncbi:TPA: alanine racemase [Candidatus Bathyarchaeota archaeon]|nr:alanine racemase [Candidatus Bathyarchaeota archaeon]
MTHPFWLGQPKTSEIRRKVEGYGSWLEIDLDTVSNNLAEIHRHTKAEIMPCVKNNAYGHGLLPIAAHMEDNGVKRVLVAKTREAIQIRENTGLGALNMDPLWAPEQYESSIAKGVTQVVYTLDAAKALSAAAKKLGKDAGVFVKVDTGLRRVGVWHEEAPALIEQIVKLPRIRLEGIMSTLMQNPEQDKQQIARIKVVADELRSHGVEPGALSLASTDATLNNPAAHLDLVRPGMSLYGVYPEAKDVASGPKLRQALLWKARIEYAKTINRGDSVTYWGKFVAPEDMRIGTVHVGFYDGVPREMANKARILINGMYRSSLGSISLNHILLDLRGVDAKQGDVVEVISRTGENDLSHFAATAGWMTYSILNHLNPYTPRVYTKKGEPVALLEP